MFLWPILQFCLLILIIVVVVTQIIQPALTGNRMFWLFRKADSELLEVKRELSDLDIKQEIKNVKDQVKKKVKSLKRNR